VLLLARGKSKTALRRLPVAAQPTTQFARTSFQTKQIIKIVEKLGPNFQPKAARQHWRVASSGPHASLKQGTTNIQTRTVRFWALVLAALSRTSL